MKNIRSNELDWAGTRYTAEAVAKHFGVRLKEYDDVGDPRWIVATATFEGDDESMTALQNWYEDGGDISALT